MLLLESRVADLEIKLSATEHHVETLSQAIYKQHGLIDQLIVEIRALKEQAQEGGNAGGPRSLRDDLPPHY
jgi:SlyX protein